MGIGLKECGNLAKVVPRGGTASIPNRDDLKQALLSGGATDIDVQTVLKQKVERVDFYPIPTCDITELIAGKVAFDIESVEPYPATLRFSRSKKHILGTGAFKVARFAQITLNPLRACGLGSQPNEAIALKWPYLSTSTGHARLSLVEESSKLFREANCLYWAKALLNLTYNYIHHCVAEASEPPPFDIPEVRFVEAALLLTYTEATNSTPDQPRHTQAGTSSKSTPGSVTGIYLAEELIDIDIESGSSNQRPTFTKFVHNSDPSPFIQDPGEYGYETAEFLAFTQHIQYVNTTGLVYISDYQAKICYRTLKS
ncbi:hypothetical protein JVT61DRAFT_7613 [Boletus reticuloceps]|uniref:Alpha-type protein kinase domain-containing protein n=1 Tax=Boletus reticuloceps TaxID=495285 RepID=A0A8I2YIQ7_9AGAM|nr:hypothetical protein JVT61DRAFT_7613 [Boletus reticuloceps]